MKTLRGAYFLIFLGWKKGNTTECYRICSSSHLLSSLKVSFIKRRQEKFLKDFCLTLKGSVSHLLQGVTHNSWFQYIHLQLTSFFKLGNVITAYTDKTQFCDVFIEYLKLLILGELQRSGEKKIHSQDIEIDSK